MRKQKHLHFAEFTDSGADLLAQNFQVYQLHFVLCKRINHICTLRDYGIQRKRICCRTATPPAYQISQYFLAANLLWSCCLQFRRKWSDNKFGICDGRPQQFQPCPKKCTDCCHHHFDLLQLLQLCFFRRQNRRHGDTEPAT